ncbi:nicotinamide mononucleotide transporter [symbiont of Argiope bruennichi]|uniref:nicotinamide riboside transporter PnuC n=1 Tax=symbiont of Argiope bruennichi TaxID=2810479 RepID=UPI003DA5C83C
MITSITKNKPSFWHKVKNEFVVIKDDLKSFSLPIKILLLLLVLVAIFNSFFNFKTGKFEFIDPSLTLFKQVCKILNGFGTIAGVITVGLVTKKKISTFYWSYIYIPIYALYCASIGLWAIFQIQMFFFLPCSIAGLFIWKRNMNSNVAEVKTTPFEWKETLLFLGFFIIVAFFAFYEFKWINQLAGSKIDYSNSKDLSKAIFDAITSCLLMTGQVVQLRRKNFTMLTWLIADIGMMLSAIIPPSVGWADSYDFNVIIMTTIFVILAAYGIFRWNILPMIEARRKKS